MGKKLNYGLIGCGMMGREHIRNIHLLDNSQVFTILEPDSAMREEAQKLVPNAIFVNSLEEMAKLEELDCYVIASPNHKHIEQLQRIQSLNPLPILVEKPVAIDQASQAVIDKLDATYPHMIWVAMEYRYMPPVAEFIKLCEYETGGIKMLTIREHRFPFLEKVGDWNRFNKYSGGTFVEKCCHFFDLMRLIINSEPKRIMASGGQANNHLGETYDGAVPDIWDHGYVLVDFANGVRAMLELCMFAEGSRYQEEISAIGPKGKIECFVPGPERFWPQESGPAPTSKLIISPRNTKNHRELEIQVDPELLKAGDHNGSTFYQHQKFHNAVLNNTPPEVSLKDGWKAVQMGLMAQKSAQTGQAIEINF